ncbi:DUF1272 domain-containing protein [Litoribacillus peritrichatus]|uniref:DUF1272 domain-containing protein n=1 Tax=Litoribacillus peritrichatus TaxID=718191 RepID=A0ABP7N8W1_9GAMM
MLKMKKHCEKCNAETGLQQEAYICSYECTFCKTCTEAMSCVCPNCAGELVRRPTRLKKPLEVVTSQVKEKIFGK